ncbi:MAG: transporter, family, inner rane transport protein [Streptomyces sp.]|nr:transporter, family, inner rane transport protein [Streptomyces sp.]
MPLPMYALIFGVFSLGTAESVIAGLLPELSADLGVSLSQAGLLVTVYAVTIVIGGPLVTLATSRLPRKGLLLALMGLFTAGNVLAAVAPGYGVLMAARVVSALSHCTLFALALVTASELAGPARSGAAVARVIVGVNLATIAGVPLGLAVAQVWDWRATFWGVAALSLLSVLFAARTLPAGMPGGEGAVAELRVLKDRRVQTALLLTVLGTVGGYATFTFLTPLLREVSGFDPGDVTVLLFLFGLGSLAGGLLGGRLADRALMASLTALMAGLVAVLPLFAAVASAAVPSAVLMIVFSVLFFALNPGLGARILGSVPVRAPTVAVSLSVAAVQTAIALGAWSGGRVLDAGLGLRAIPLVGGGMTLLGVVVSWAELRRERRAATESPADPLTAGRAA